MGQSKTTPDLLRVVILNQYYHPDVASTGHLLHELAQDLNGRGIDVSVLTSFPCYGPPDTWQPALKRENDNGVQVRRIRTTRYSKDRIFGRLLNSTTFLIPLALRVLIRGNRNEVFLYTTNPPYLGVIGAITSLFKKHRYVVLLHDAYPQMAVLLGKIRGGQLIDRLWHRCNKFMYQRAEQTIVLCQAAKRLVCDTYGIEESRVHVIANWADEHEIQPVPKASCTFAKEHDLVEPFTVMYSGNLGLYYDFETILDAAEKLRDENFRLVLIGSGGKKDWIADQIKKRNLTNTLLLPYQPFETLNDSLNSCDISLVSIAKGVEGISYPSKFYSSLSIGKPVLALSEDWSELRHVVESCDVGLWCEIGDSENLVHQIRKLMKNPRRCSTLGKNARQLFLNWFTLSTSAAQYAEVLSKAAQSPEITHDAERQNPAGDGEILL